MREQRSRHKKAGPIPKTWYKRMLRAYFPLVLIAVSAVLFISFIIVSEMMMKEAEKANGVTIKHMINTMESRLQEVEGAVLREMQSNQVLHRFISSRKDDNMRLTQYELSNDLNKLIKDYPIIHSIYVFRASDDIVLTQRLISPLVQFPDRDFIEQHDSQQKFVKWQQIRMFADNSAEQKEQVISLLQRAPLPLGSQGLVVVNVKVSELASMAEQLISPELTRLEIRDAASQLIYPQSPEQLPEQAEYTFQQQSAALGWSFYSGVTGGALHEWVSVISYIWIAIGICIVIGSLWATVYIAKRNYRPLELVLQRIQQTPLRNLPKDKALDEFSYIERALENLVEQTKQYERQHQEDLTWGKRQLLRDLLEGQPMSKQQWKANAKRFFLPGSVSHCCVALIEIKSYGDLEQGSAERDKSFLKFSLANAVLEHLRTSQRFAEAEWMTGERLAVLLLVQSSEQLEEQRLVERLDSASRWIRHNLSISVRAAIGNQAATIEGLAESYQQAQLALGYQLISSPKNTIIHRQIAHQPYDSSYAYYQALSQAVRGLHQLNDHWSEQLDPFFEQMYKDSLSDQTIMSMLHFALMMLLDEADAVTDRAIKEGLRQLMLELRNELGKADQLSELQASFFDYAERFYKKYAAYKRSNKYLETINQVRSYMEQHFTDPNLSLTQIGDKFGLKPKYASQLFKEEFHMKFVDYLVQLRMEEAKKRLCDSDEPVHEIAAKVGYASAISFGRMFKKTEGITPGDYRKLMTAAGDEAVHARKAE